MTIIATADGWSGGFTIATADGWPALGAPVTADGFVTPTGPIGGGATQGWGGGGGFHKRKRKPRPFYRLDDILSGKAEILAREAYEELHATNKAEQAGEIVHTFAKSESATPMVAAIDWKALNANAEATGKLLRLWHEHQIALDDEDFFRLLGD